MENFRPPFFPTTTSTTTPINSTLQGQPNLVPPQDHPQFSITHEPAESFPSAPSTSSASQYYCYPGQYLAPVYTYPHYPTIYPLNNMPVIGVPCCPQPPTLVASGEQDQAALASKAARKERKLARQRRIMLSRANAASGDSSSSSGSASTQGEDRKVMAAISSGAGSDMQNPNKDLYTFCTPDNKKLKLLLKKELKNSDVGSLSRIVLPKKEAEENLPVLSDKEGIPLMIRDVYSNQEWGFRYKYWSNNKSRMYILEYTGDFVQQNKLGVGDCICLYEDECKNLYLSIKSGSRPGTDVAEPSSSNLQHTTMTNPTNQNSNNNTSQIPNHNTNTNTNFPNPKTPSYPNYVARDEEDESSLALLIEQLQPKDKLETNTLVAVYMDHASSSHRQREEATTTTSNNVTRVETITYTQPAMAVDIGAPSSSASSSSHRIERMVEDHFDEDCYQGLGALPEVDRYNYSLLDYNDIIMNDDNT